MQVKQKKKQKKTNFIFIYCPNTHKLHQETVIINNNNNVKAKHWDTFGLLS